MSQAPKLTLEQKLVNIIKDDSIVKLLDDDEAIIQLVERSLREALFSTRQVSTNGGGWNSNTITVDSPIVEAAKTHASNLANKIADDLFEADLVKKTIRDAMIDFLPKAIEKCLENKMMIFSAQTVDQAVAKIIQLKSSNALPGF